MPHPPHPFRPSWTSIAFLAPWTRRPPSGSMWTSSVTHCIFQCLHASHLFLVSVAKGVRLLVSVWVAFTASCTSTHLSQLHVYVCLYVCLSVTIARVYETCTCGGVLFRMYSTPRLQVYSKCGVFYHTIYISQLVCAPCLSGPLPSPPTQSYANTKGMKWTCIGGQFARLP